MSNNASQEKLNGRFVNKKKIQRKSQEKQHLTNARKKKILLSVEKRNVVIEKRQLNSVQKKNVCEGSRIVDVQELGQNLKCRVCGNTLSMENIIHERLVGLHPIWEVRCIDCNVDTEVHGGKQHLTKENKIYSDVNSRTLLGVLHSGSGFASLNKLLACINVPVITNYMYKKYEKEVGLALEEAAKESCTRAAEEERELMITNVEKLSCEL